MKLLLASLFLLAIAHGWAWAYFMTAEKFYFATTSGILALGFAICAVAALIGPGSNKPLQ